MKNKAAAWCERKVFRIMAVTTWLYTLPLVGMVIAQNGWTWGLFVGLVATPVLSATIGILATDKVSRPLPMDWQTEVFQRVSASPSPVQMVTEGQDVHEKELAVA
jgi:hypothetical protein